MKNDDLFSESHSATYCPEDDKIRLYVGRVPRDEYEALRAEGWTSTPKQDCDFVAVWTTEREDTALSYAGIILDEDQGPEDRAADRAERFGGYLDKRLGEATGHADRYDAGPSAHGFQSQARADRAAARHDRIATHAVNAWEKAEYWQRRTAGVISHALHVSSPSVRMGRIKTIEAELRKAEKTQEEQAQHWRFVSQIAADPDKAAADYLAASPYVETLEDATRSLCEHIAGHGKHRNPADQEAPAAYYFEHMRSEKPPTLADYAENFLNRKAAPDSPQWQETRIARFITHCRLRLAYENQMIEAQGGRAAFVEMEKGGTIGSRVICKINKSTKTGRVVSVDVIGRKRETRFYRGDDPEGLAVINIETERLPEDAYNEPTEESRAALAAFEKAQKDAAAARKAKTPPCPLVNPTDEDAERLQAVWNAGAREPKEVTRMSQAQYSARSGGTYAAFETVEITGGGKQRGGEGYMSRPRFPAVAKIREHNGRVIVIIDKPQKALPANVWHDPRPETIAEVQRNAATLRSAAGKAWLNDMSEEESRVFQLAQLVGMAEAASMSQFHITAKGNDLLKQAPQPEPQKIAETPAPAAELSPVIAGAMETLANLTQAELFA